MHGNILNNHQIVGLIDSGALTIQPFDRSKLRLVDYPLHAKRVLSKVGVDGNGAVKTKTEHVFGEDDRDYIFSADAYRIVEVDEFLVLPTGLVGYFTPSSNLIEHGFAVVAGRIQHPFGRHNKKTQRVRFGIKNLTSSDNTLSGEARLAHIHFVDLRSLRNLEFSMSREEKTNFEMRSVRLERASDDGVDYGEGDED